MTHDGLLILLWMFNVVIWSVLLADTRVGDWVVGNPVSRRFILPVWEQIKRPVRALERAVRR